MDQTDKKLMELLQQNGRLSLKQLGEYLGISSPAVSTRMNKLEANGYLEGIHARFRRELIGYPITAFVQLALISGKEDEFCSYIKGQTCVLDCFFVTGEYTVILKTAFPYTMALDSFVSQLRQFGKTTTNIVISSVLERLEFPLS